MYCIIGKEPANPETSQVIPPMHPNSNSHLPKIRAHVVFIPLSELESWSKRDLGTKTGVDVGRIPPLFLKESVMQL